MPALDKKSDSEKRFILWDPKDGEPRKQDGEFISDGVLGRVGLDNAYIRIYPEFPEGTNRPENLEVGESILEVTYRLSGSKGTYDIYRVA